MTVKEDLGIKIRSRLKEKVYAGNSETALADLEALRGLQEENVKNPRLFLLECQILVMIRDFQRAEATLLDVQAKGMSTWRTSLLQCRIYFYLGKCDELRESRQRAVDAEIPADQLALVDELLVILDEDVSQNTDQGDLDVDDTLSKSVVAALKIRLNYCIDSENADAAIATVSNILRYNESAELPLSRVAQLVHKYYSPEKVETFLNSLNNQYPSHAGIVECLVLFYKERAIIDRFQEVIRKNWLLLKAEKPILVVEYLRNHPGEGEIEISEISSEALQKTPQLYPSFVQYYLSRGSMDKAIEVLEQSPQSPGLELLKDLLKQLPEDNELLREALSEDSGADYVVSPKGTGAGTVVAFTGSRGLLYLPIVIFDRFFARLGLTAIYLRDESRVAFYEGVRSLGPDRKSTATRLRELIDDIGDNRLYTFGTSWGGTGALLFGAALKADQALAFSPGTSAAHTYSGMDTRGGRGGTFELRNTEDVNVMLENYCVKRALQSTEGATPSIIYYGENMPEDKLHAEFLREMDGVVLAPIEDYDRHDSFLEEARRTGLINLFNKHWEITN